MRTQAPSLASLSGLRIRHCHVGQRYSLDLVLLWQWPRPAAVALIRPLAWKPACAVGAALKRQEKKKKLIPEMPGFREVYLIQGFKAITTKTFLSG